MRGLSKGIAALAVGMLLGAPALRAQGAEFSLGAGISIPTGQFDETAKLGWQGTAGVSFVPANLPIGFQFDGTYSRFGLDGGFDVDQQFIYGTGNAVFKFKSSEESNFRPYLIGGLGVYNFKLTGSDADLFGDSSETKFGLNAGAGFDFKMGGAGLFIEGRFHRVFADGDDFNFIPISVGLRFGGS
jgi:hypothetical protein